MQFVEQEVKKLTTQTYGTGFYWLYDSIQRRLLICGAAEIKVNVWGQLHQIPWYSFSSEIVETEEGIIRIGQ